MSQGEHFLDLWLRASGGDVFGQRAEASGPLRVDSPDPEGGLSRPPPLWSVLEGLEGREKKLRPKHLPNLGPAGGPGQVQPHVGPFRAFCPDSGLVLSFPAGPQRGGSRPARGKVSTTRDPQGDLPLYNGGTSQIPPLLPSQKM